VRGSHLFDIPHHPHLDLRKYFMDYLISSWHQIRFPPSSLLLAYIYIERYVNAENTRFPPQVFQTVMVLNYNNCHL